MGIDSLDINIISFLTHIYVYIYFNYFRYALLDGS